MKKNVKKLISLEKNKKKKSDQKQWLQRRSKWELSMEEKKKKKKYDELKLITILI